MYNMILQSLIFSMEDNLTVHREKLAIEFGIDFKKKPHVLCRVSFFNQNCATHRHRDYLAKPDLVSLCMQGSCSYPNQDGNQGILFMSLFPKLFQNSIKYILFSFKYSVISHIMSH